MLPHLQRIQTIILMFRVSIFKLPLIGMMDEGGGGDKVMGYFVKLL